MADTLLNQVLSGLHNSDKQIWSRLSGLSGQLSTAFSADKIAIGTANGITASNYTFISEATSAAFAQDSLSTKIANADAVKDYVDDKITELNNQQGTALTGITVSGAVKKADGDKTVEIGIDVDGTTIAQVDGKLSSVITLTKLGTATEGYAATYQLQNSSGTKIGDEINIPKDQFLSAAVYNATTESIDLTFAINGEPNLTSIPVSELVHEYVGGNGVAVAYDGTTAAGQTTISAVIDSAHNDGKYLTLDSNGIGLSGIEAYVTGQVSEAAGNATAGLTALSAALGNTDTYLSASAIPDKFTAVEGEISNINTKLGEVAPGTSAASGKVLITDASGNIDVSDLALGGNTTASGDFGAANTLATENATKKYVNGAIAANSTDLTTGLSGANQFVLTDGDKKLATTGLTLDTDMLVGENSATTIPTTLAVQNYIEEGLSGLQQQINTLLGLMGVTNP